MVGANTDMVSSAMTEEIQTEQRRSNEFIEKLRQRLINLKVQIKALYHWEMLTFCFSWAQDSFPNTCDIKKTLVSFCCFKTGYVLIQP